MRLAIRQIYEAAIEAGFTPDQATTWTAIAMAESGGETGALNDSGEHSVGLWQINLAVHKDKWGNLHDPVNNARAAYELSHQGTDMRPWTVTHASNANTPRDYRTYLDDVSEITGYDGDARGVGGYRSAIPDPLPSSGSTVDTAGAISTSVAPADLRTDPGSALDTDQDGLTDAFEQMIGSDVALADSDADGLSDSYETVVSRTDVHLGDTDEDTLTDSAEQALGTSGTTWDTDNDGASDGAEVEYGRDALVADGKTMPKHEVEISTDTRGQTGATETSALVEEFLDEALDQKGDDYEWGAFADAHDPNPEGFDCSALTQWAAAQVGAEIPRTASEQYLDLKQADQLVDVDEALRTPGALLFYFSDEPRPGGGRPRSAHVAISLGDGRTIEARGSAYGVVVVGAKENEGRFNHAGVIQEMEGATPAGVEAMVGAAPVAPSQAGNTPFDPDADNDGLSDDFEKMLDLDPSQADTDHDGIADAEEALGGPQKMSRAEVRAALAEQGLAGSADEDADGLSNRYEIRHGLDVHSADSDTDGLTDGAEIALGTNASALDTDYDGVSDQAEVDLGTDPMAAGNPTDGWGLDTDADTPDHPQSVGAADDVGDFG